MKVINEHQRVFLIAEFQDRRTQILNIIKQIDDGQKYALAATVAFWTWIASQKPQVAFYYVFWFPVLVVLYFMIKWRLLNRSITSIATYVRRIEEEFELPNDLGWEHRDDNIRKQFGNLYWVYWFLLILLNVTLAVVITKIWL